MKIIIHSPPATIRRTGNRQTSSEWARFLGDAGHDTIVTGTYSGEKADLLIALHAVKSREAVLAFRTANPDGKIILALTGTDIYPRPTSAALDTMSRSDGIITLQKKAILQVPSGLHSRVSTVIQSASKIATRRRSGKVPFQIAVVGHLRRVKDPLLTARAVAELPAEYEIVVHQAGGILEDAYANLVSEEEALNVRYRWLGELSELETAQLLADSDLLVLSSKSEGGARVVGEAIVHDTPVLSTRIDGVEGLLGADYPGYFPVGSVEGLRDLLERAFTDPGFYSKLKKASEAWKHQFAPEAESASLLDAVDRFDPAS